MGYRWIDATRALGVLCLAGIVATPAVRAADVPVSPASPDPSATLRPPATVQTGPGGLSFTAIFGAGADASFGYTGRLQTFVAPAPGIYKFDVVGADGGPAIDPNSGDLPVPVELRGGKGEMIRGTRALDAGTVLSIYVGEVGKVGGGGGSGGGGGTFVPTRGNAPFVIAGGGGGTAANGHVRGEGAFRVSSGLPSQDGATQGARGAGLAGANVGGGAGGAGLLADGRDGETTAFGRGASHGGKSVTGGFAGGTGASYITGNGGTGGYGGGGGGGDGPLSGCGGGGGGGGWLGGDGGIGGVFTSDAGGAGGIGYDSGFITRSEIQGTETYSSSYQPANGSVRIHLISLN